MMHPDDRQLEAFAPYAREARKALEADMAKYPASSREYVRSVRQLAALYRRMRYYGLLEGESK
jgi:hypothetical protein